MVDWWRQRGRRRNYPCRPFWACSRRAVGWLENITRTPSGVRIQSHKAPSFILNLSVNSKCRNLRWKRTTLDFFVQRSHNAWLNLTIGVPESTRIWPAFFLQMNHMCSVILCFFEIQSYLSQSQEHFPAGRRRWDFASFIRTTCWSVQSTSMVRTPFLNYVFEVSTFELQIFVVD